jgi:hypothetical protein
MGVSAISWRTLEAWQAFTGIRLEPVAGARLLRRLSGDWLRESDKATKPDWPAPWVESRGDRGESRGDRRAKCRQHPLGDVSAAEEVLAVCSSARPPSGGLFLWRKRSVRCGSSSRDRDARGYRTPAERHEPDEALGRRDDRRRHGLARHRQPGHAGLPGAVRRVRVRWPRPRPSAPRRRSTPAFAEIKRLASNAIKLPSLEGGGANLGAARPARPPRPRGSRRRRWR